VINFGGRGAASISALYINKLNVNRKGVDVFCVESEIAPLKKVIISNPLEAIRRIVPDNTQKYLFDDILYTEVAENEHKMFAKILKENGVDVFFMENLLEQTMKIEKARKWILKKIFAHFDFKIGFVKELYEHLLHMSSQELCFHLVAGLTVGEVPLTTDFGLMKHVCPKDEFIFPPHPNHYFTRDPSCWIGNGVTINHMHFNVRRGESLNFAVIYKYHPMFVKEKFQIWNDGSEDDAFSLEGGDIFSLSKSFVMVGFSERTSLHGVETLAHRLFSKSNIERILLVEIPKARTTMHLDTIMTMVDEDTFCVAFAQFTPRCWTIRPKNGSGTFIITEEKDLKTGICRGLKINDLRIISVGDVENFFVQQREQWTDGSNVLALAPGVVVGYERNEKTNARLRAEGIKVHEIAGAELGRARGGARCMSCPIERRKVK
jgi:arginine deiminase